MDGCKMIMELLEDGREDERGGGAVTNELVGM
jgi:hypothetical protein